MTSNITSNIKLFRIKSFFRDRLTASDSQIYEAIRGEYKRQQNSLELIASENIVSSAVLEAQGSVLTNKYAEGYPGARYYGGCLEVDKVEILAIERAKKLFNVNFVNVQSHSGSQANQAAFFALLKPHDTILGLALDCGGHLTHGFKVNLSGKWFNAIQYGIHKESGAINYEEIKQLTEQHKPKLIIAGCSSYPRRLDFAKFREIANSVNAYLMVDMAHFAGLVAAGKYPNPVPHAHVITTTTHKTLRGPRGGMILSDDPDIAKAINRAVFPGIQGGPLMHVIAAKAVAFKEALSESYKTYIEDVVLNAQEMVSVLKERGFEIFTGGTDCHLFLVDLRNKKITGKDAEISLENAGLTCNKNSIPFDTEKPTITSGIRIGTPAIITRGLGRVECRQVANYIADVLDNLQKNPDNNSVVEIAIKKKVTEICTKFPIYV